MDTNIQTTKKTIEDILSLLDVSYELTIVNDESIGTTCFQIKTEDPHILIGHEGAHLAALSHIIKRIADKTSSNTKEQASFMVDVNNYQGRKTDELKNKATMLAERARYFKSDVEMSPMSPYERMIIHSSLSNTKDIKTESVGEGRTRRVVIKYIAIEE